MPCAARAPGPRTCVQPGGSVGSLEAGASEDSAGVEEGSAPRALARAFETETPTPMATAAPVPKMTRRTGSTPPGPADELVRTRLQVPEPGFWHWYVPLPVPLDANVPLKVAVPGFCGHGPVIRTEPPLNVPEYLPEIAPPFTDSASAASWDSGPLGPVNVRRILYVPSAPAAAAGEANPTKASVAAAVKHARNHRRVKVLPRGVLAGPSS